jgi:hypothetical protein
MGELLGLGARLSLSDEVMVVSEDFETILSLNASPARLAHSGRFVPNSPLQ